MYLLPKLAGPTWVIEMTDPVKSLNCSTRGLNSSANASSVLKGKPNQPHNMQQFNNHHIDETFPNLLSMLKSRDTASKAQQSKISSQLYALFMDTNRLGCHFRWMVTKRRDRVMLYPYMTSIGNLIKATLSIYSSIGSVHCQGCI